MDSKMDWTGNIGSNPGCSVAICFCYAAYEGDINSISNDIEKQQIRSQWALR